MNIKKLLTITLICIGFAASASGQVVSQAYELSLSAFTAPTTTSSNTSFKECDECDLMRVRVTATTNYSVNGSSVLLEDFRLAVSGASDPDEVSVVVLHHLESDTVVSIDVSI